MTKQKKLIISIVAAFCALIVGVGAFFGAYVYYDNLVTVTINDTLPDGQGKKAKVILLGG